MTDTTRGRTTKTAMRSHGTYPIAANTLCLGGTIACVNASGETVPGALNAGFNAVGKYKAEYDNRTTAPYGGAAGALKADVDYQICAWSYNGRKPIKGEVVFVYDNQSVSVDSNSSQRGIAGYVYEVVGDEIYVSMGPDAVAQIVIASAVAADVVQAQADIDALQVDAATANAYISVPLTSFTNADATPLAKFASAGTPTLGLNIADSKALNIRWNNDVSPGTALCQVALPPDVDDAAAMVLELLVSKSGATLLDATKVTVAAYIIAAGNLHDADTNCGGDTAAVVGDATAKTTTLLTRTIAAADVPASAKSLVFSLTPSVLGTDDLMLHSVGIRYTRKIQTS